MKTGKLLIQYGEPSSHAEMTKNAGMEEFYEKMGGELRLIPSRTYSLEDLGHLLPQIFWTSLRSAVTPEEAAVPFADFVDKLTLEQTGKFWAPSELRFLDHVI